MKAVKDGGRERETLFRHGISSIFTIDFQESRVLNYLQILQFCNFTQLQLFRRDGKPLIFILKIFNEDRISFGIEIQIKPPLY